MILSIDGLIIKEMAYKESSKIITILTKEHGAIGVIAHGAKKIKSNIRSQTQPLTYVSAHLYYKNNGLSILKSIDVLNQYALIKNDVIIYSYASMLLELTNHVLRELEEVSEVYDLLLLTFNLLNKGLDPQVLSMIYELKMLDYLGVNPILDSCASCGTKENVVTFSAESGGYLCKECLHHNEVIVSPKSLALLRQLYLADLKLIEHIQLQTITKQEIRKFIDGYYDKYTGLYLKSKNFIAQLGKLN